MICKSTHCKYWVDNCIRKNVTIVDGKCPHYGKRRLRSIDVLQSPLDSKWEVSGDLYGQDSVVFSGSLLEVLHHHDKEVITVDAVNVDDDRDFFLPEIDSSAFDTSVYLLCLDTNIYAMYLESMLITILEGKYEIQKLDISSNYLHICGEKR